MHGTAPLRRRKLKAGRQRDDPSARASHLPPSDADEVLAPRAQTACSYLLLPRPPFAFLRAVDDRALAVLPIPLSPIQYLRHATRQMGALMASPDRSTASLSFSSFRQP